MKIFKRAAMVVAIITATSGLVIGPAQAGGQNFAHSWESWFGGRWNGYVQIQASYNDGGRHAKGGYHRFKRKAGPQFDTGRMWTEFASSPWDDRIHSRQDWVWDSPLWGEDHTTTYHYGFIYW